MNDIDVLAWNKSPDGLLPCIVQDAFTGEVLMQGYMNRESLRETFEKEMVTFYSRSQKKLWTKGETSGNTLDLYNVFVDCDADSILVFAMPNGPTCHNGTQSCWGDWTVKETVGETLAKLWVKIGNRAADASSEESYTKRLLEAGWSKQGRKLLEEAAELVTAVAEDDTSRRLVEETADLLYHLFVFMKGNNVNLSDVASELQKRRS